ncbi:MAG: homoserine dehydrogenase [Oscillospiraceae bacterium]|jgi:homoserine dehydrogenase|nr:homoserine dehydrogenase [Oscillospiraceae bacterium]
MINIAVLGFGVVGSGVVKVLETNAGRIAGNAGDTVRVKYIVDVRDFPGSEYARLLVKDFSAVERDPEVTIVVETIGGSGAALDFTRRCLLAGKSVVTSNKELVASHGHQLLALAREMNVNYLFEASVGGGIPILRPISQCLAANEISEVFGILNGTTNYVLTRMIKEGESPDFALRRAREEGYAEADPTDDLDGRDACRKICILAALCFGRHVYPGYVRTEGIGGVTLDDADNAGRIGFRIKLLGRAFIAPGGKIAAYVAPHLISEDKLLANVDGVMNGIVVRGNAIGEVLFYGAGAGRLPTASAIAADVIDAAKHSRARKRIGWEDSSPDDMYDSGLIETPWYVRTSAERAKLDSAFNAGETSIINVSGRGEIAFTTPAMSGAEISDRMKNLPQLSRFRILPRT